MTAWLIAASAACSNQAVHINEGQVIDTAWKALKPNTSSGNFSNWDVEKIIVVKGSDVADLFEGEPAPGCWKGPEPPQNELITPSKTYCFVQMVPKPATPFPVGRTPSPTEPPFIPEPFLREAFFLIDIESGNILASKLHCVIY